MDLFTISISALTTLVLGMSGIIWRVITGFVERDSSWKTEERKRNKESFKELNDRLISLELRIIKEMANHQTQTQKYITHMEKEMQQISAEIIKSS